MGWVKLDDGFAEHPKIAAMSDAALALWVTSLAYCNRNLTDGFVPHAVGHGQLRYSEGNPVPAIRELEALGSWEAVEGGWKVHDYEDFQPSREGVLATRNATRERVKRHRNGVRNAGSNAGSNAESNGVTPGTGSSLGSKALELQEQGIAFDAFWTAYPRKVGKPKARAAFLAAVRRGADPERIVAGAVAYRDDPNRSAEFTAHPTTWLNRDGWEDEPLPSKGAADLRSVAARKLGWDG